ncbi:hypothetical protein U1Q18_003500 [Sarracenia purpurea var. burkii]
MGSEAELERSSTPKLRLLSILPLQSPERSGMLTPPLHACASVPFRWEEEPGKPRPCTTLIAAAFSDPLFNREPKSLDLPPRLQLTESKMTKTNSSPTTVLDGPDVVARPFHFSSFRFKRERQGSFGSSVGSPESGRLGEMVLISRRAEGKEQRGFFGSDWGRKGIAIIGRGKKEVGGGCMAFSRSMDCIAADFGSGDESDTRVRMSRIRRNGSYSTLSDGKSHFWSSGLGD